MHSPDVSDAERFEHLFDTAHSLANKVAIPPAGDCPYTLFVGAGASVTSGIRPAAALIDAWRRDLFRAMTGTPSQTPFDENAYKAWTTATYPGWLDDRLRGRTRESEYAVLFSRFHKSRRGRQIFIEREIDGKVPSFGYLYLAGLVAARRINRILTTNFDDLINDALVKFYDTKSIVCAFDSAIRSIRFDSLRPKLLKLHGDFLYDNIKNVGDEVVRLDANMEEKFLHTCKEGGLIVVGYDGNDESIMGPLQMMVRSSDYLKMGLHWCLYQPNPNVRPVVPERLRHLLDNYSDRITLYPIAGFDELMLEVFNECKCEHPEVFTNPGRKNLFKEFQKTVRGRWQSFEVPAGMNEHLELYLERSGAREMDPELELDQADVKHRKGNLRHTEKDLVAARVLFEASRKQARRVLNEVTDGPLQFRALARITGATFGLMECAEAVPDGGQLRSELDGYCDDILDATRQAEALQISDSSVANMPLGSLRVPYYNVLCMYALRATRATLTEAERALAVSYYTKLSRLDPKGEDRGNLKTESYYSSLRTILGESPSL